MKIIAKQIESSNIVFLFKDRAMRVPDPSSVFALYAGQAGKGSMYSDNVVMSVRVFEFPAVGLQWVFEAQRVRLEDRRHRTPDESRLTAEGLRVIRALFPEATPIARGFNYDIIYRMDNVIPVAEVMANFVRKDRLESIQNFGWQYTVSKDKGKNHEMYFIKAVSPIEFAVHANYHFQESAAPDPEKLAASFERHYALVDQCIENISF